MRDKIQRANTSAKVEPPLDAETIRLANLQLTFLDLVGVHMGPGQTRALAAACRARLALEEHDGD